MARFFTITWKISNERLSINWSQPFNQSGCSLEQQLLFLEYDEEKSLFSYNLCLKRYDSYLMSTDQDIKLHICSMHFCISFCFLNKKSHCLRYSSIMCIFFSIILMWWTADYVCWNELCFHLPLSLISFAGKEKLNQDCWICKPFILEDCSLNQHEYKQLSKSYDET